MSLKISSHAGGEGDVTVNYGGGILVSSRNQTAKKSVSSGVETTLIEYEVPTGDTVYLSDVICSGEADGIFRVYKNTTKICEGRTSSSQRTFSHSFSSPYKFSEGDFIRVKVIQYTGSNNDYWANIFMVVGNT